MSPMSDLTFALSSLLNQVHSGCPVKHSGIREYHLIMGYFNREWLEDSTRTTMMQLLTNSQQLAEQSAHDYISILDDTYTKHASRYCAVCNQ